MTSPSERIKVGDRVTIRKRGSGGTWQAEFHFSGEHRRKSLKTKNKKIAVQRASQLDAELVSGE